VFNKIFLGQPTEGQWEDWVFSHVRILMMETGPPLKRFTGPPCAAVIQDYFSEYSCCECRKTYINFHQLCWVGFVFLHCL